MQAGCLNGWNVAYTMGRQPIGGQTKSHASDGVPGMIQNRQKGETMMWANKVEISGINTATLVVLKEKERIEYLKKMKEGDPTARDKMINGNLKLVLSMIQRFSNRGESLDDLFQVGCIGLMKAIDNFDASFNVRFSTYCVPMIIGEIRRFLRDNSNSVRVSRSMKDTAYKAMQAKEQLTRELDREPNIEEIAAKLELKKAEVVMALESIVDPVSLYEPIYADGGDPIYVMDQLGGQVTDTDWIGEIMFKEALERLGPREKNILMMRFFKGKTQVEVANEIGISQAQVSRLEKGALNKIKADL